MLKTLIEKWASTGDRTRAYNAAKRALGWILGEPPDHSAWNTEIYTRDVIMEGLQLQAAALQTYPPQITADDLCAGGIATQWADPTAAPNTAAIGGAVRDAAIGFDLTTETPFLWVLRSDNAVHKVTGAWSYSASPSVSSAVSLSYPSTPDEVHALCADSTGLYVVWGIAGDDLFVSKFNPTTGAEIWTTDTGYAQALAGSSECVRIIMASSDAVAVLLPGGLPGVSARAIGVLSTSDGTAAYGTGSYVSGYGDTFLPQNSKLVSDGTHVYWVQYQNNTTFDFYLLSASIADPTTSAHSSIAIHADITATDWFDFPTGLFRFGANIGLSTPAGLFSTAGVIEGSEDFKDVFNLKDEYTMADNFTAYAVNPDTYYDTEITSDGLNAWCRLIGLSSDDEQDSLYIKVPLTDFSRRSAAPATVPARRYPAVRLNVDTAVADLIAGKTLFDGRDLWFVARAGNAYRIVNPGAR